MKREEGDHVTISLKGHANDGHVGVVHQISPSGDHYGVKDPKTNKHIGYFHSSNLKPHDEELDESTELMEARLPNGLTMHQRPTDKMYHNGEEVPRESYDVHLNGTRIGHVRQISHNTSGRIGGADIRWDREYDKKTAAKHNVSTREWAFHPDETPHAAAKSLAARYVNSKLASKNKKPKPLKEADEHELMEATDLDDGVELRPKSSPYNIYHNAELKPAKAYDVHLHGEHIGHIVQNVFTGHKKIPGSRLVKPMASKLIWSKEHNRETVNKYGVRQDINRQPFLPHSNAKEAANSMARHYQGKKPSQIQEALIRLRAELNESASSDKMIKFTAEPHHKIGSMIRMPRPEAKFWKVCKIVDGKAYAKPAGFGSDPRVHCE